MTGHIRRRKTKSGLTWQVILDKGVSASGKRIREYIAVNGTQKAAKEILNQKISEYNSGTYIEPSVLTVKSCIEQWLIAYAEPSLSPSTLRGYRVNFEKHTYPYIGHIPLQKLSPVDIQYVYSELGKKGLSPRSIRYVHTTLREVLQYACKMRLISVNVTDFVTTPKQTKFKASVYNECEVAQMLRCAEGTDLEIPLLLDVETGLRRGELLALKWSDIDWEAGTADICRNLVCIKGEYLFQSPKTESGNRTLLLSKALLEKLKQHRIQQNEMKLRMGSGYHNNDLICCRSNGLPYQTGSFSHKFGNFLSKHNLKGIRFHDLRHTNATLMLKNGVPAKIASERLGHANIAITLDTYSHVSTEMQQGAVDKLSIGLFGA